MEKSEILNAFFASLFTSKTVLEESQAPGTRGKVWNKTYPPWKEHQISENLNKLDTLKFMGHKRLHPQVLRKLHDIIASSLSIISETSWQQGEVPEDWRKANITATFKKGKTKDPGNYTLASFTTIPEKIMEQLILEATFPNMQSTRR